MKIAISGTRKGLIGEQRRTVLSEIMAAQKAHIPAPEFMVGDCPTGVDALAREHATPNLQFDADWNHFGKYAGPERNGRMIDCCDMLIAFPMCGEPNKGTKDAIRQALEKEKEVKVVWI